MTDIISKIAKRFPSDIDLFHAAIERRKALTNDGIEDVLKNVFAKIDPDVLSPELQYRYNQIKDRLP